MAKLLNIRDNAQSGSLTPSHIVDGAIYVSAEYSNSFSSNLFRGGEITLTFANLISDNSVRFQAVLEGKNIQGQWSVRAYQFDPFRISQFKQDRVILFDPLLFWQDAGISNIVYVGGKVISEISPQQVTLPETWRIKVMANNVNASFVSLDLDINAELYNPE